MRLERMTWPQAGEYFSKNDIILLSVGSIECHGKHLPLGTDTLIPQRLLELIEPLTDVAIAPIIPFGACDSQTDYPGTVSLGHDTLYQVFTQLTQGYRAHGVRRFAVLNGHGGNISVLDRVALDLQRQGCMLAQLNWWLMAWDLNPVWTGGHGGAEETAGVLAVDPSLVDWSAVEDMKLKPVSDEIEATGFKTVRYKGVSIPLVRPVIDISDNGWIGPDHPKNATEQWGNEMLSACAQYIADFLGAFRRAPLPQK
ncbi:MAG: creatininase family protein [Clostridia bacterium]|nr:creatininase family protein [Clostridia bacterium]